MSLTRQKKKTKSEKKSCTHITAAAAAALQHTFPHGPLNRYTPRIFHIIFLLLL